MNTRVLGKINRENFKLIFSKIEVVKKRTLNAYVVDKSNCSANCPFYNSKSCYEQCDNANLKLVENSTQNSEIIFHEDYINDTVVDKDTKSLSKSQILQYLGYHFLPLDGEGKYDYIIEKDFAEYLGINVKTFRRNNEVLQALGLINYSKEEVGVVSVELVNYKKGFKANGVGTVNLPINFYERLLKMDNIDEIRVALFLYEKYFSYVKGSSDSSLIKRVFLKAIKKIIPNGKNYSKRILSIIDGLSEIFITKNKFKLVEFRTNEKFLDTFVLNVTQNKIVNIYETIFEKRKASKLLDLRTCDDIIQLGLQYGLDILTKALEGFRLPMKGEKANIGALVRTEIEELKLIM